MTLDPLVLEHYWNTQLPEEKKADLSRQHARLKDVLEVLDVRLDGREFIAGDSFTAADVVLASILHRRTR
ncbi:glutathione S-transferase C-terminal domain-containing protein [Cystobacter fuscus]